MKYRIFQTVHAGKNGDVCNVSIFTDEGVPIKDSLFWAIINADDILLSQNVKIKRLETPIPMQVYPPGEGLTTIAFEVIGNDWT